MPLLVDSNVLLDVLTEDAQWYDWSAKALARQAERQVLAINPIIYAEISIGFERIEDLDAAVKPIIFHRLPLPWEAAFLAGKCFVDYRRRGGARTSPMVGNAAFLRHPRRHYTPDFVGEIQLPS